MNHVLLDKHAQNYKRRKYFAEVWCKAKTYLNKLHKIFTEREILLKYIKIYIGAGNRKSLNIKLMFILLWYVLQK